MANIKLWLRGIGIVLVLGGIMSFPLGSSLNPERWTSRFYVLADLGILGDFGFLLAIVGVLLFVISVFVPDKVRTRY
jgi:hypothetical protein